MPEMKFEIGKRYRIIVEGKVTDSFGNLLTLIIGNDTSATHIRRHAIVSAEEITPPPPDNWPPQPGDLWADDTGTHWFCREVPLSNRDWRLIPEKSHHSSVTPKSSADFVDEAAPGLHLVVRKTSDSSYITLPPPPGTRRERQA